MPRKSSAALAMPALQPREARLQPHASLGPAEAEAFRKIVAACSADHFRPGDMVTLTRYAETDVLAEKAAAELRTQGPIGENGKISAWVNLHERCTRSLVMLARRLRLDPLSRLDPKTLFREKQRSAYGDLLADGASAASDPTRKPPPWARDPPRRKAKQIPKTPKTHNQGVES